MKEEPDWLLMYGVDEMGEQCPRCKRERSQDEYGSNYRCAECQLRALKKYKDKIIARLENEIEKLQEYAGLIASGLSDSEARGTVWPEERIPQPPPSPPLKPREGLTMSGKNDICARCGDYVGMLGPSYLQSTGDLPLCLFCKELVQGYEKMQENGFGVVFVKRCSHCHKVEGIHFLSGRKSHMGRPPKEQSAKG